MATVAIPIWEPGGQSDRSLPPSELLRTLRNRATGSCGGIADESRRQPDVGAVEALHCFESTVTFERDRELGRVLIGMAAGLGVGEAVGAGGAVAEGLEAERRARPAPREPRRARQQAYEQEQARAERGPCVLSLDSRRPLDDPCAYGSSAKLRERRHRAPLLALEPQPREPSDGPLRAALALLGPLALLPLLALVGQHRLGVQLQAVLGA